METRWIKWVNSQNYKGDTEHECSLFYYYSFIQMAAIVNNGTMKNKPHLVYEGMSYILDRTTDVKTYWRCVKFSADQCRSRLHPCISTNAILKPPTEHTCKVNGTTAELRFFNEQIAYRAINIQEAPDAIITHCYTRKNRTHSSPGRSFVLFICSCIRSNIGTFTTTWYYKTSNTVVATK